MSHVPSNNAPRELSSKDFLHMFFSPVRVPGGLTNEEKQICIKLYGRKRRLDKIFTKIREREIYDENFESLKRKLESDPIALERLRENFSLLFGENAFNMSPESYANFICSFGTMNYEPIVIPNELRVRPMTRESFAKGIAIITARLDELEQILRDRMT